MLISFAVIEVEEAETDQIFKKVNDVYRTYRRMFLRMVLRQFCSTYMKE